MKKLFIKNRKNQKIAVILEENPKRKGLVFMLHGLGGFKEQPFYAGIASAFYEKGFSVVRFDTTNTYGESEGKYEDATITNYYEDLEDVINWSKQQGWYQEPFWLVGHSLGAISVALYAEKFPKKIEALVPLSVVVSGQLMLEATPKDKLEEWGKTGWRITPSSSRPGLMKKLKWEPFKKDILKYDLLDKVDKLTMPVLMIVGSKDESTPPNQQKVLYNKIPGKKEFHIIKGSEHTFREKEHLDEIKKIFLNWIDNLD